MRLRIDLAYDGTDFHGWAVQPGLRTVQGELSEALARALRVPYVADHLRGTHRHRRPRARPGGARRRRRRRPHACRRTVRELPPEALVRRLNGIISSDVRVRRVTEAADGFDARFSALWRRYAYRIADTAGDGRPADPQRTCSRGRAPLDLDAMNEASALLVGRHDFASFCKQREGATTIRTLLDLHWTRDDHGLVVGGGAGRRVLPQHGALAGRLPDRRSARAGDRPPGPARSCAPGRATRPSSSSTRTGSPSRRSPTRPTTSSASAPSETRASEVRRWMTTTTSAPTRRCRSLARPSPARCGVTS